MSIKTKLFAACAGVVLAGGVANAELNIDVRQLGTDAKQLTITAADLNKPITLGVFASVTGAKGNAKVETLRSVNGSFVSAGKTLGVIAPGYSYQDIDLDTGETITKGPFTYWGNNGAVEPTKYNFGGGDVRNGKQQDLDGDGDIDLGGKPGDETGAPGTNNSWFIARTATDNMSWAFGGKRLADGGVEFQVAQITFTPTQLGDNTFINFVPRKNGQGQTDASAALWTEDGTGAANGKDGSTGVIAQSGFEVIVPEPASMSLLALGALALLGRRNRK